ncbi:hypothetical protein KZ846_33445, partial [Pseudomonas aeruginosa]|nr:hypothetical protein [Pseudomonas aeruginosa]
MGGLLGIPAAAFEQAQAPVDLRRSEHLRGVFRPAPPPVRVGIAGAGQVRLCLLYTSPSPRDIS